MKVLTYTSYKVHYDLYTEIHGSIAVDSSQIGLFKKDKILLEDNKLFKYSYSKASSSGVFKLDDYIGFTSCQKIMRLLPTVIFSLRLVCLTKLLKMLT